MSPTTVRTALVACLTLAPLPAAPAAEIQVIGTHDARFNLTQTYLGAYRDHTPLEIVNVRPGKHKLFVKSLVTDELIVFPLTVSRSDRSPIELKANFRPPHDEKNMQARRRTAIAGAAVANETLGDGSTTGRVVVGAAAIANELIKDRSKNRQYNGAKYGNTLEIKTQEDVDVNLDGQGKKTYAMAEAKRWHHLSPGSHKVYIRSTVTQELKLFRFDFPGGGETETITIRPDFRPPQGETVNAQARRRTGILGALAVNEVAHDGTGKKDVRLVGLAAAAANELIGTKAGRHREAIRLDMDRLPRNLPEDVE